MKAHDSKRTSRLEPFDLALLAVPAVWAPAQLAANNLSGIPHPERLIAFVLAVWAVGLGVAVVLARLTGRPRAVSYTVFVVMTGLVAFGGASRQLGTVAAVALVIALGFVVAVLTSRNEDSIAPRAIATGLAVALLVGPASALMRSIAEYGESMVVVSGNGDIVLEDRPDIWLVVLDGYPGMRSLQVAHDTSMDASLVADLVEAGFQVPESVWASYPSTKFSVPSVLSLGYPATHWTDNAATTQELYDILGGDNEVVRVLNANGYETTMIESGWSGSSCGASFDRCEASPLHDSSMDYLLHGSIVGAQAYAMPGVSFAISAEDTMRDLVDMAGHDGGQAPSFVFAHVLAPHSPFFLDQNCSLSLDRDGRGFFYPYPGVAPEARDARFAAQVECVNRFVSTFVAELDPGAVVVLLADHGTDRSAQMGEDAANWTESGIVERMNPFLAVRAPNGCEISAPLVLPNLMRRVFGCLGGSQLEDLPSRIFIDGDQELSVDHVDELLGS